jgi:hypothetical protein
MDTTVNHFRNAIYILGTGLASTQTFTVELKVTYEMIPTTSYKTWATIEGPRASNADL